MFCIGLFMFYVCFYVSFCVFYIAVSMSVYMFLRVLFVFDRFLCILYMFCTGFCLLYARVFTCFVQVFIDCVLVFTSVV